MRGIIAGGADRGTGLGTVRYGWTSPRTLLDEKSACRKLAAASLRNAFERGRLDLIISIPRPVNTVSTRSLEKLGLQPEYKFESEGVPLVRYVIGRSSGG
jgi:hypothetical protein